MTPSGALTCAAVWELTAYTNGYMANTNHFSGELHRPILQLGISYGLSSLTELPPPIHKGYGRCRRPDSSRQLRDRFVADLSQRFLTR